MTQKDINIAVVGMLGTMLGVVVALCVYIYLEDKAAVESHLDSSHREEEKQQDKMQQLSSVMQANQLATLDKIYTISLTSSNNIKDLQINAAKSEGNYKELAQKVDNMIASAKEDRQLYMSKFDEYEKRIGQLEKNDSIQDKNINIIAKDRGIRLFSATW